mmetsp:Transcript_11854/g.21503  ORF Transcript_11854/g.21503 Transcript_11854/m.21503 type:complete len:251 (-) Transcript_11854:189-941(-)
MECRLCLDAVLDDAGPEEGELIFPCSCRMPVHRGCLDRWQAVQLQQVLDQHRSVQESVARALTCEVCGARLVTNGTRILPLAGTAICRAHGGVGKVALRRVPTLSRDSRNFSEYSASEGQELEVIEQDTSGEFFRVRVRNAARYREDGAIASAEGWIRHVYLEWPEGSQAAASMPPPCMPPAYASRSTTTPAATASPPAATASGPAQAAAAPPLAATADATPPDEAPMGTPRRRRRRRAREPDLEIDMDN